MAKKYFWIIGGGLMQVPLIEEARKLDLKVIVSDMNNHCACREQADVFICVDIFDIESHIKEAKRLTNEGKEIVGVLAAGIDAPETMAAIAETLKLPSVDRRIAHLVHNKYLFRKKLRELGYPVPRFVSVGKEDIQNLEKIIDDIGFPLIVKNTDSSGSRGTKIFREKNIKDMKKMLAVAMRVSKSGRALIEECWEGLEQTVETIFDVDGNFHRCFITDRIFDRSSGYAMELGLRQPSSLPESTQEEMYQLAENIARDLGIKIGAAKFDMILTDKGPRVIEMTVRLSGGFDCQYLVPAATGKNVMRAAILTALNKKFPASLLEDTKHRVGLTGSIWPKPGKITNISGVDDARALSGVEHIFFRYEIGDTIEDYVDCTKRVCFIIVTGKNEDDARKTLARAKKIIKITTK